MNRYRKYPVQTHTMSTCKVMPQSHRSSQYKLRPIVFMFLFLGSKSYGVGVKMGFKTIKTLEVSLQTELRWFEHII